MWVEPYFITRLLSTKQLESKRLWSQSKKCCILCVGPYNCMISSELSFLICNFVALIIGVLGQSIFGLDSLWLVPLGVFDFFFISLFPRLSSLEALELVSTPESVRLLFSSSEREIIEDGDCKQAETESWGVTIRWLWLGEDNPFCDEWGLFLVLGIPITLWA